MPLDFFFLGAVLSILISLLSSCLDITDMPSEYFPNTPGDSWTYEVTDSTQSTPNNPSAPLKYTVKVKITEVVRLVDGKKAMLWRYQYPWGYDTAFVRTVADSVMVFVPAYAESIASLKYPRLLFLTPFAMGHCWSGKLLYIDSLCVTDLAEVATHAGTFEDCFNIDHLYVGPNIVDNDSYWFEPSVGMVKMYYDDYKFGPRQFRTWKLIAYALR